MNKILGAFVLMAGLAASSSVWAACATTIPVEDSTTASHTFGSLSDASGNCLFETGLLGSTGAVLDGAAGTPAARAVTIQGVSGGTVVATTVPTTGNNPGNNANQFTFPLVLTSSTASTSFIPLSSGKYAYITGLSCFNSSTTGSLISFQNGSGGTTIWEGWVPATFGFATTFPTPMGGSTALTVSTAVYAQAGTSVASLYCNASGFYQ